MVIRRSAFALGTAAVLFMSSALSAQGPNTQPRKLSNAEKKEILLVQKMVDAAVAGQAMPNDLSLTWLKEDVLKAQGNKQYLPFNVSVDPSKVSGGKVSFYWRVVSKEPAAPVDPKSKDKNKAVEYPYEDLNTVTLEAGQTRISRSFTVLPGSYDVFVLVKEPTPEKAPKNAPPQKASLIKQTVVVPDLWNGELTTSSVIVAERIDPLPVAPTPDQQGERPYALGTIEIVPATSSKFAKKAGRPL